MADQHYLAPVFSTVVYILVCQSTQEERSCQHYVPEHSQRCPKLRKEVPMMKLRYSHRPVGCEFSSYINMSIKMFVCGVYEPTMPVIMFVVSSYQPEIRTVLIPHIHINVYVLLTFNLDANIYIFSFFIQGDFCSLPCTF